MNVVEELTQVFHTVFEDDTIVISPEMTADDLDAWDSFSHMTLLMSAEEHFGIEFASREMMNLPNVGALIALIEKKLAAQA